MIVAMSRKAASGGAASLSRIASFFCRATFIRVRPPASVTGRASRSATGGAATSARVAFAQIVASALHNQSDATLGEHVAGYGYLPGFKAELGAQPVLRTEGFVGWNPVTTTKGTQVGTQETAYPLASIPVEGPGIPLDGSITVPVTFDPDRPNRTTRAESMGPLWIMTPIHLTMAPHYRYRLDYLRRAASGIAASVAAHGATPLANQAAASITYLSWFGPGGVEQVGHEPR